MDGEDEFDRMMDELIGPGIERDWSADAQAVSSELHSLYGAKVLTDAGIQMLASGLQEIEFCNRENLQASQLDKTKEQALLREVKKHAGALRSLLDRDTEFGARFLALSERLVAGEARLRRGLLSPGGVSPVAGIDARLAFVETAATHEHGRLNQLGQRRRVVGKKTEILGRDLPALYQEVYPNGPIGTYDAYKQELDGARHRFVQMCAEFLGYPGEAMANIEKMARAMKNAKSASDE